jgi:NADH-quinone oxidoreductase subunit N
MMVVFLASLTGIPPMGGFVGKFYLFAAVLDKEWYWLVIVAGLNSVVALSYYFKIVKAMFLASPAEGADTSPLKLHWLQYTVLAALAIPTIGLGLYWGQFRDLAEQAILAMTVGF